MLTKTHVWLPSKLRAATGPAPEPGAALAPGSRATAASAARLAPVGLAGARFQWGASTGKEARTGQERMGTTSCGKSPQVFLYPKKQLPPPPFRQSGRDSDSTINRSAIYFRLAYMLGHPLKSTVVSFTGSSSFSGPSNRAVNPWIQKQLQESSASLPTPRQLL